MVVRIESTPIGLPSDTRHITGTKLLIFNPDTNAINVSFKTKEGDQVLVVPAKSSMFSPIVPYGSAAEVFSNHPFSAMSITDAELYVDTGDGLEYLGGRYFDWGCPLIPREQLTTQVLVGWGFGKWREKLRSWHF